jgi:hypothetical protein
MFRDGKMIISRHRHSLFVLEGRPEISLQTKSHQLYLADSVHYNEPKISQPNTIVRKELSINKEIITRVQDLWPHTSEE